MLEIKNLHVKFHNREREAVSGVELTIHDGEILGLVGESGSGKSVTAMSVAGLLPRKQCAYSGKILLDGAELLHADRKELRKLQGQAIGVVFQEPMSAMDPLMKIGAQVEEVLRIHTSLSREERKSKALEAMAAVELPDPEAVYEKYPHELSGGMLQRAMIASAIVIRPRLLLLDEPTTALDVTIQAQVLELMNELKNKYDTSMIMITHDLGIVAEVCDTVAVMYAGRIVEQGTLVDIFDHTKHPYTEGLFNSLPNIKNRTAMLKPIKGLMPDPTELPEGCTFAPRCDYATEECFKRRPQLVKVSDTHSFACLAYEQEGFHIRRGMK